MKDTVSMNINGYHTDAPVYTLLDAEDYAKVCHWKWQQAKSGYARRNVQITLPDGSKKWKIMLLHRVILGVEWESEEGTCVDHINGNRLDNRKCNLRIVSLSKNASNRHIALSSSGEIGVTEQEGRYMARLRREHESIYLGCYGSAEEARDAITLFESSGIKTKEIRKQRKVKQYSVDGRLLALFMDNAEAGRKTGICSENISRCANGKRKTAGGFIWRYSDE